MPRPLLKHLHNLDQLAYFQRKRTILTVVCPIPWDLYQTKTGGKLNQAEATTECP